MSSVKIILLPLILCCICGIQPKEPDRLNQEMEATQVTREFCTVMEINDQYMVLENVRKERYQLPVRYNDGYKDGDMVVLSYLERTGKGDNLYETVPRSLFAASAMIEIPCKRQ